MICNEKPDRENTYQVDLLQIVISKIILLEYS